MNLQQIREKLGDAEFIDYGMNLANAFIFQTLSYGSLIKAEDQLRKIDSFRFNIKRDFNKAQIYVQKLIELQDQSVTSNSDNFEREIDFLFKLVELVRKRNMCFFSDDVLSKLEVWNFALNKRDVEAYNQLKDMKNE